jgi:hypothetical protein
MAGMKALLPVAALALVACSGCADHPVQYTSHFQRFILIPQPAQIKAGAPESSIALDTQTGQLCYTVGGNFTAGLPAIDMCTEILKYHP